MESQMSRTLTVSSLCLLDDASCRTRDYVVDSLQDAARRQSHDLIVAPLTSFLEFREETETEELACFAAIARQHRTYLAVALLETTLDSRTCCTSVLLDRDGRIAGKYRKTHALPDDSVDLGDQLPVFRTDFGTVGLSLGTDFYFPEVYAVQYMQGAEILVWQHEPERFREHFQWVPLLKARALDSHAHFVASMYADPRCYIANRHADGMQGAAWGRSMILNRVGTPVADTGHEDGAATAIIDLDRRRQDPYKPYYEAENIFFVNCLGDRTAFQPLAEPCEKPVLPDFAKRRARIAVGHFWTRDVWRPDSVPETMLRVLDQAAESRPDLVLLSEMSARGGGETMRRVADMVAEKARQMGAYVLIGGLDDTGKTSHAWIWNREGEILFSEPIYWTKGFDEIKIFDADFARLGVHLCGDLYTFEVDRTLALKGAEIILDPSQMWGADGYNNELMLRARAVDNGCWMACAHWNSSDPGLRSLIVDPYGYVVGASHFQQEGAFRVDIDFDQSKVYYADRQAEQKQSGTEGISTYYTGDLPEQRPGWRDMIFARRRPELYGILPAENEVTRQYRPAEELV